MGVQADTAGAFAYPPHLLASCAAVLRVHGWQIAGLDAALLGLDARATLDLMPRADVVVLQVSHGTQAADRAFLNELRRRKPLAKVLAVGPALSFPQVSHSFSDLVDLMVAGEPELALPAAIRRTLAGEERPGNVVYPYELAHADYWPGGLLADLDALPLPAWEIFTKEGAYPFLTLLSSRGCPAGCGFCPYVAAQGHEHRTQSPARTANELHFLANSQRAHRVMFRDPVFARDRSRVLALCAELRERPAPVAWECESRPEHFDDQLLRALHAAGCDTIKIGLETADPELLAAIGRVRSEAEVGAYLAHVANVIESCRQIGIVCRVFVMVGLPDQSADAIDKTARFLRQVKPARLHIKHYTWYPGIRLAHAVEGWDLDQAARLAQAADQPELRLEAGCKAYPATGHGNWQWLSTAERRSSGSS